jgi:hypothetical protein
MPYALPCRIRSLPYQLPSSRPACSWSIVVLSVTSHLPVGPVPAMNPEPKLCQGTPLWPEEFPPARDDEGAACARAVGRRVHCLAMRLSARNGEKAPTGTSGATPHMPVQTAPRGAVRSRRDDARRGAGLGILVGALGYLVRLVAVVAVVLLRHLGSDGTDRLGTLGGELGERTGPERVLSEPSAAPAGRAARAADAVMAQIVSHRLLRVGTDTRSSQTALGQTGSRETGTRTRLWPPRAACVLRPGSPGAPSGGPNRWWSARRSTPPAPSARRRGTRASVATCRTLWS